MNPSAPTTVAALREKLAGLPDTDAVVLCNADEHTLKRVVNHVTHDRHSHIVVLHLEEAMMVPTPAPVSEPVLLEDNASELELS